MLRRIRVIPVLTVDNEKLVKTVKFKKPNYIGDPVNAVKIFNEKEVDEIVLLDIEMPGETGLEVARKIAQLETPPAVIFTTAYDQYALEAFDTSAGSYLLKPVQQAQLEAALKKAKNLTKVHLELIKEEQTSSQRQHITAKGHRGIELIALGDIRYFMADQKYVMVIGVNGKVLIDETLKELETEFARQFIRVHRNSVVSVKHILGLDRDRQGHYSLRIADIEETPIVSRRYASKIKSLLKIL